MSESSFSISLRVEHPTDRHEAIAHALELQPTFAYSVGEPRKTPRGGLLEGVNKKTYCCFDLLSKQAGNFTDGIKQLIPTLDRHSTYLRKLTQDGGRAELFVGVFTDESTGFTLDVDDMSKLVRLSLELAVEVYY